MTTDDDRGLVALAVALHKAFVPDDTPGHELDDLPEAAAILGPHGVFLPDGPPAPAPRDPAGEAVDTEETIARLARALNTDRLAAADVTCSAESDQQVSYTRDLIASKIQWEGGVIASLEYGIRSADIEDVHLRVIWRSLETLYDQMRPLIVEFNRALKAEPDAPDVRGAVRLPPPDESLAGTEYGPLRRKAPTPPDAPSDRGHFALIAALHHAGIECSGLDEEAIDLHEDDAAAILGPFGVYLPEGLPAYGGTENPNMGRKVK